MYYLLYKSLYNSKLLRNKDNATKKFIICIVGSVGYVLAYSYLFSKYVDGIEIVEKYRKMLFLFMIIDLVLTYYSMDAKVILPKPIKRPQQQLEKEEDNIKINDMASVQIPLYESKEDIESVQIPLYKSLRNSN